MIAKVRYGLEYKWVVAGTCCCNAAHLTELKTIIVTMKSNNIYDNDQEISNKNNHKMIITIIPLILLIITVIMTAMITMKSI